MTRQRRDFPEDFKRDTVALVEQVVSLLDDPAERQRLGSNARKFAVEHYDLQTICLPRQLA